ncbi:glycoside hydrolase family 16 protein [Pseudohyphozyma bogoriensis]|nr:glycoside hydrolase family 16 protein [Pseudohyphozyma bogoriensis]
MMLYPVLALSALASLPSTQAAYSLTANFSGSTFFDGWDFYGNYDNLTNGDAIFVNQSASSSLAYVNDAGNTIIKVDNTTVVPYNIKRDTVRITTSDTYAVGSLFVFDALHLPYGCSVWPAFWAQAPDWPAGGEIDIFEGVNLQTANQMALHTETGCMATGTSATETGNLTYANCSTVANSNSGCTVDDVSTASYGSAFAEAGGGVWAAEFANDGISIWFFTRSKVPSNLLQSNASAVPETSGWGTPSAYYPNSGCTISEFFAPQHLTIDITLCGDWAGNNATFQETCSGTCYTDYVLNASTYNTAYFEIQSVRVYFDAGKSDNLTTTSTATTSAGGSSSTGTTSSGAARGVAGGAVGGVAALLVGGVVSLLV